MIIKTEPAGIPIDTTYIEAFQQASARVSLAASAEDAAGIAYDKAKAELNDAQAELRTATGKMHKHLRMGVGVPS